MTWPTTRLRTYAPGSQVFSDDLNKLQDIGVGGVHGDRTEMFGPWRWRQMGSGVPSDALQWNTITGYHDNPEPNCSLIEKPPLRVGDRIKALEVYLFGSGTEDYNWYVAIGRHNPTVVPSLLGAGLVITNVPAAWTLYSLPFTPYTLLAGEYLFTELSPPSSGTMQISALKVTWDHPP